MRTRIFQVVLPLTGVLGIFIGYRLAGLPNLHPYKLLNILGLFYSLFAIFVLSEVLIAGENWKKLCVEWIAPILLWSHITVPVGAVLGAGFAWLIGRGPSAPIVAWLGGGTFVYMCFVGSLLEQAVVRPQMFKKDTESRWRWFGLILLSSGILLQIISAIQGL